MLRFTSSTSQSFCPSRATPHSAGWDLFMPYTVTLFEGNKLEIDTQVVVSFPTGFYGQLHLRSSAARRFNIILHGGVIGNGNCVV